MKYSAIAIISLTLLTQVTAQVQKGAILTGGSFSFNALKDTDEFSVFSSFVNDEIKRNFISARPQIGFFTNENTLLGIGLTHEYNSLKQLSSFNGTPNDPFVQKSSVFLINPYLTKYSKLANELYFTTSINFLAGLGKGKYGENDELETDMVELRFNVAPGLTYFISEKWILIAGIGQLFYNWKKEKISTDIGLDEDPENKYNNYGVSFSFNTFGIGFQYMLNNG